MLGLRSPFRAEVPGGGLPRAAPLASSGLALGYHRSPRWGWGARNGVLEMVGSRSWQLATLDSRLVAVEPVLYIVVLVALAVGFCWLNDRGYLRPGPTERDAVYILYHDGSETEELAVVVSVFVGKIRQAMRGHS